MDTGPGRLHRLELLPAAFRLDHGAHPDTGCHIGHPTSDSIGSTGATHEAVAADVLCLRARCSATNRLIHAKDKAAVQINIAHVNADGVYMGDYTTMALCGFIRGMGEADGFLDRLWTKCYEEHKGEI